MELVMWWLILGVHLSGLLRKITPGCLSPSPSLSILPSFPPSIALSILSSFHCSLLPFLLPSFLLFLFILLTWDVYLYLDSLSFFPDFSSSTQTSCFLNFAHSYTHWCSGFWSQNARYAIQWLLWSQVLYLGWTTSLAFLVFLIYRQLMVGQKADGKTDHRLQWSWINSSMPHPLLTPIHCHFFGDMLNLFLCVYLPYMCTLYMHIYIYIHIFKKELSFDNWDLLTGIFIFYSRVIGKVWQSHFFVKHLLHGIYTGDMKAHVHWNIQSRCR